MTVRNAGPLDAQNVMVTDTLPVSIPLIRKPAPVVAMVSADGFVSRVFSKEVASIVNKSARYAVSVTMMGTIRGLKPG